MKKAITLLVVVVFLVGCSEMLETRKQAAVQAQAPTHFKRFVPVPLDGRQGLPWSGFFALDTETGQLCRTSNFVLEGDAGWMTIPTCVDLGWRTKQ
jgi:hypothetical protein